MEALLARSFGFFLLSQTMNQRHEISLQSYDRLFPNQDMLPRGGFGNLIALPLQRGPREQGNTMFLGEDLKDCPDQWQFLATIERLTPDTLKAIKGPGGTTLLAVGVRDADIPPSTHLLMGGAGEGGLKIEVPAPPFVEMCLSNNLAIPKLGMGSPILRGLKNLAAFANPEFYQRQRMRLSVARTPRLISCFEEDETILALPRGCKDSAVRMLKEAGSKVTLVDKRSTGTPIDLSFAGQLSPVQESAIQDLLLHESGVLVAPPGAGKTVVGCRIVAERKVNTLVIVHRQELLLQWTAQIEVFLGLNRKSIGHIGGGKRLRTGVVDVAMMQSLFQGGKPNPLIAEYGHIVVDECHHCPAYTFERVLSVARAKYFTGLTATPQRRDGRHPIIEMQLGPVRHTVPSKTGDGESAFRRRLLVHATDFRLSGEHDRGIQEIYSILAADETRNDRILDDIISALEAHRSPLLLTERREHLEFFAEKLKTFARNLIVLHGGMTPKGRRLEMSRLAAIPGNEERLLIATGRYLGEGFDDARLDTLFLALPVSWKGILVQYAGRLHRMHPGKHEVVVHDYVDEHVPILQKMFEKRLRGYRAMGYAYDRLK
ncbi:MAG: DEAD/DEAH box helicase family protein [Ignavibacteriae bacterium]|nr:DEAD/DEAH box helicase family protein [Ignavibacteriota bacterium]